MIGMFDSAEAFAAYTTIDAGYYMIGKIREQFVQRSGIAAMVDVATGYQEKLERDAAAELEAIIQDIIEAKGVIGADCSTEERMLNDIQRWRK